MEETMKKFLLTFAVCALVAPMFTACAEKCAPDDCKCITQCSQDYIEDKCGKAEDVSISKMFDYLACLEDIDVDKVGDSCIEDYNKNKSYCDGFGDWD